MSWREPTTSRTQTIFCTGYETHLPYRLAYKLSSHLPAVVKHPSSESHHAVLKQFIILREGNFCLSSNLQIQPLYLPGGGTPQGDKLRLRRLI